MSDKIDNKAFAEMEYATADKTAVNLLGDKAEVTSEDVHNMLMAAGMTPQIGNVGDLADAILYAAEGEFGKAGLSMAAVIPFIGQAVSAKRALKVAKKSGEKMHTFYRGVDQWFPGKMVKKGKFVGGKEKDRLWVSTDKSYPEMISSTERGVLLEFEVPDSFLKGQGNFESIAKTIDKTSEGSKVIGETGIFNKGLPKEFLKKVRKPPLGYYGP